MKKRKIKVTKTSKSRFNCPVYDPKAKTNPWFLMVGLCLLVIAASVMIVNFK